jgi:hypothetical protein
MYFAYIRGAASLLDQGIAKSKASGITRFSTYVLLSALHQQRGWVSTHVYSSSRSFSALCALAISQSGCNQCSWPGVRSPTDLRSVRASLVSFRHSVQPRSIHAHSLPLGISGPCLYTLVIGACWSNTYTYIYIYIYIYIKNIEYGII